MKLLLGLFCFSGTLSSDAAIVYRDEIDLTLFSLLQQDIGFDIDDNGVDDLTFRVRGGDFNIIGTATSRIIATPAIFPDIGADVTPLNGEIELENNVGNDLFWYAPSLLNGSANFLSCRDIGCLGEWRETTAFLGVEFSIEENTHYGWLEIEAPFGSIPGGYLRRLAYEDEANKSILTGSIPEPNLTMMAILGMATGLFKRRRI